MQTTGGDKRFAKRQVERTYQQYYHTRKPIEHAKLVAMAKRRLQVHNPILRRAIQMDKQAAITDGDQFSRVKWEMQMWETDRMFFEDKRFLHD